MGVFLVVVAAQVSVLTHPFSIELREFLADFVHLLLVGFVDEAFDAHLIRLSNELDGLALVGSLLATLTGLLND